MHMLRKAGLCPIWAAVGMSCVALLPQMAAAALGEPESAIAADAQKLNGSIKSMERGLYRVHEMQLPSGTLLREFATPEGAVFAVAWSGPVIPNLRQALGHYFDVLGTAARTVPHSGHSHLELRQDDLVVQSSGHMGAFKGRAYLPQTVPAGISLDEIH